MKYISVLITLIIAVVTAGAQNPYKYESVVIVVSTAKTGGGMVGEWLATSVSPGGFNNTGVGLQQRSVSYDINKNTPGIKITLQTAMQMITDHMNGKGYTIKTMAGAPDLSGVGTASLIFEKSTSYREAELYKLISELTTRIDTTAKKYTDSAMRVTHTNVLNYLQSIPNEVITQAYKDQLSKMILAEAEEKIRKVVEELKKEIRNSTTGNN
jgi:hypothetical protein